MRNGWFSLAIMSFVGIIFSIVALGIIGSMDQGAHQNHGADTSASIHQQHNPQAQQYYPGQGYFYPNQSYPYPYYGNVMNQPMSNPVMVPASAGIQELQLRLQLEQLKLRLMEMQLKLNSNNSTDPNSGMGGMSMM